MVCVGFCLMSCVERYFLECGLVRELIYIYFKDNILGTGKPAPHENNHPLTVSSSYHQSL